MKVKLAAVLSVVMAGIVFFTACSKSEPLKVATHPWIGYESLTLAQQIEVMPDTIHIFSNQSASESLERIEAGQVDAATLTLDEVLQARSRGTELTIVLVMDISSGADAVYAREAMPDLQALKGKRIAYEKGAVGELVFQSLLANARLQPSDVMTVNFPVDRMEGVWRNNLADVVICYEPTTQQIEKAGGVRIFDSKRMPNTIFDVLAVRSDALSAKSKQVKTLIAAHFQALGYLNTQTEQALQKMSERNGDTVQQIQLALEGVRIPNLAENTQFLNESGLLSQAALSIQRLLIAKAMLSGKDGVENLVSNAYLPK